MSNTNIPDSISFCIPGAGIKNKVAVIKALRSITGVGLKDAMDMSQLFDVVQTYRVDKQYFTQAANPQSIYQHQINVLLADAIKVAPTLYWVIENLRKLAGHALELGDDDLANDILQLVLAEKLRKGI